MREHGRVIAAPARGLHTPYAQRRVSAASEKQRIATAAAHLIADSTSGIIDDGSTCEAVAAQVSGRPLTALTLSVHAALALGRRPGTQIVTPAGVLDPDELSWTGARAAADVRAFCADWAVMGACAFDLTHGLTSTAPHDAEMKQAVLTTARRIIVVALPEKLERTATFVVAPPSAVDVLVTTSCPPGWADELAAVGIEVIETDRQP